MKDVDWNLRYQERDTPWERGRPHPEFEGLFARFVDLVKGAERILVPGCGFGHDAVLLSEFFGEGVIEGLDLAETAICRAEELYGSDRVHWRLGDLFEWSGEYDLVLEHTCFCAISPERRSEYAQKMSELIVEGGYLMGIFFLDPDLEGQEGPPHGVELSELKVFFNREFELVWSGQPEKTFRSRLGDGRELGMLWRRR